MQFISFRVLSRRIKAISSMMKDKTVPKRKKTFDSARHNLSVSADRSHTSRVVSVWIPR